MKLSVLALFIIFTADIFSQQAADYFPEQLGHKWNYRISILDSVNNPIPELTFFQSDSSSSLDDYEGKLAYHILTKKGSPEVIQFLPYIDTNYVHLTGTDGYEYFDISEIETIIALIDSADLNDILPFLSLFESFSGWRLAYRFAQNVNQQYDISSFDTTVIIDSLELPLRFTAKGKRLQDETLETEIGIILCKKFVITNSISYLIIFPPFPPVPVLMIESEDTVWIAPGNWIVKDIIPSTNVDLEILDLGEYIIPGFQREITSEITGIEKDKVELLNFNLKQNYPNPFNPSTNIGFRILNQGFVSLKVYDILGNEVAVLLNEAKPAGDYEILFDSKNLASGVYFYTLIFSDNFSGTNYSVTKQMLLIK